MTQNMFEHSLVKQKLDYMQELLRCRTHEIATSSKSFRNIQMLMDLKEILAIAANDMEKAYQLKKSGKEWFKYATKAFQLIENSKLRLLKSEKEGYALSLLVRRFIEELQDVNDEICKVAKEWVNE